MSAVGKAAASTNATFDALVQAEIAKGCPPSVAGQKVISNYGVGPDSEIDARGIEKRQATVEQFITAVDNIMLAKRCSRSEALQHVRRARPDLSSCEPRPLFAP